MQVSLPMFHKAQPLAAMCRGLACEKVDEIAVNKLGAAGGMRCRKQRAAMGLRNGICQVLKTTKLAASNPPTAFSSGSRSSHACCRRVRRLVPPLSAARAAKLAARRASLLETSLCESSQTAALAKDAAVPPTKYAIGRQALANRPCGLHSNHPDRQPFFSLDGLKLYHDSSRKLSDLVRRARRLSLCVEYARLAPLHFRPECSKADVLRARLASKAEKAIGCNARILYLFESFGLLD